MESLIKAQNRSRYVSAHLAELRWKMQILYGCEGEDQYLNLWI